jgi:hypothetical protein
MSGPPWLPRREAAHVVEARAAWHPAVFPMTGYELKQFFDSSVQHFWNAELVESARR